MFDNLQELINQIPNIISYFICGYIFSFMYNFVRGTKRTSEIKNLLLKSVVINFIARVIFDICLTYLGYDTTPTWKYIIVLCVLCSLVAFIMATIANSHWFNRLLSIVGVRYTTNVSIWEDVIKRHQDCWVSVTLKNDRETSYYGLFRYSQTDNSNPIIVLSEYQVYKNDKLEEDYSSDTDRVFMFNESDAATIEVIYGTKWKIGEWKDRHFHKKQTQQLELTEESQDENTEENETAQS